MCPKSLGGKQKEKGNNKKRKLVIGTWNVRRGLIKRENEIINLLQTDNVDVLFLTETDTKFINTNSYNTHSEL